MPDKRDARHRSRLVNFRVTEEEHLRLQLTAKAEGLTASELVRKLIDRSARAVAKGRTLL